jgi:hypothetical protein
MARNSSAAASYGLTVFYLPSSLSFLYFLIAKPVSYFLSFDRLGDEERRLMHYVPAPAVRHMKRRVFSRAGTIGEEGISEPVIGLPLICGSPRITGS